MLGVVLGGWSGLEGSGDWGKVPATIPVIIFSLVYHDLAPGEDDSGFSMNSIISGNEVMAF